MDFRKRVFSYLLKIRPSYLLLLLIVFTLVLTEIIVAPMSVFFHGRINHDFMITGFITAFLVSLVVFPFVILLLEHLRETDRALAESEGHMRTITSVLGEGVYEIDRDGRLTFINPEAERILGYEAGELLGVNFHDTVHFRRADGSRLPHSECPVHKTINTGQPYRVDEDNFTRKDGTTVPVSLVSTPIIKDGAVVASVAAFSDISERKRAQDALHYVNKILERQATTDVLTGVCNRLKFSDVLSAEIGRARRYAARLSLIMLDVDHFKAINDTYGHHAGDNVLREIARLVRENIREPDTFARWGGEEFMLLAPNTPLDSALVMAGKLCAMIDRNEFDGAVRVTCSFGVAELRPGDTLESLTRRADEALYKAKAKGRNRVEADTEEVSS